MRGRLKMNKTNTIRLVETGISFAIAIILSMIKIFEMPWGGSVTLCSMLPIILISYRYGTKWGVFSGFVFSIFQLLLGVNSIRGLTGVGLIGSVILDFILAFTVLGFGGVFRNKLNNKTLSLALGVTITLTLRFICSFISGVVLWGSYAKETLESLGGDLAQSILNTFDGISLEIVYSALYNGAYMIPELIITLVVTIIISYVPQINKKF